MLGLVEIHVNKYGMDYAFCDTDSMALVINDAEDEEHAKRIVDWFTPLNPYDEDKLTPSTHHTKIHP